MARCTSSDGLWPVLELSCKVCRRLPIQRGKRVANRLAPRLERSGESRDSVKTKQITRDTGLDDENRNGF